MTGIAGRDLSLRGRRAASIERDGKVVGSTLIGQVFTKRRDISTAGRLRPLRPTRRTRPRTSMRPTTPQIRAARISARPTRRSSNGSRAMSTSSSRRTRRAGSDRSGHHVRPAVSTRTFRRRPRFFRCRVLRRRATCPKIAFASLSRAHRGRVSSACLASRA